MIVWNNALINALINAVVGDPFEKSVNDFSWWGRLVENAVGAHLLNQLSVLPYSLYYWRQRNIEVDFVLETPRSTWAIEVKSGKTRSAKGLATFCDMYPEAKPLMIGPGGLSLEEFFSATPIADW